MIQNPSTPTWSKARRGLDHFSTNLQSHSTDDQVIIIQLSHLSIPSQSPIAEFNSSYMYLHVDVLSFFFRVHIQDFLEYHLSLLFGNHLALVCSKQAHLSPIFRAGFTKLLKKFLLRLYLGPKSFDDVLPVTSRSWSGRFEEKADAGSFWTSGE